MNEFRLSVQKSSTREKIKLLCVITSLTDDGPSNYLFYLLKYIDFNRFHVDVVCMYNPEIKVKIEKLGARVHNLDCKNFVSLKAFIRLIKLVWSIHPNIVHTILLRADLYGRIAALGSRAKVISSVLNQDQYRLKLKFSDFLVTSIDTLLSKYCTDLITVESSVVADFNRKHQCIPRSKYAVLPSLIDVPEELQNIDYSRLITEGPLLVSAGRLHPQKGQHVLIKAIAHVVRVIPEIKLRLYGSGPLEDELRAEVLRLSLEKVIFFEGFSHNLFSDLSKGNIFIVTPVYEGGAPIALLHALAVGLPTISTKVGGVEEFIENQVEGVLIDSNMDDDRKAEKVAEAIIAFVKDPGMAEKIGRNGRERLAKEFSADRVSRRFSEMCEELILDHLSRYRLEPD